MIYYIEEKIENILLNDEHKDLDIEKEGCNYLGNISFELSSLDVTENDFINVNEPLEINLNANNNDYKFKIYAFIRMKEDLIYRYYPVSYVAWHIAQKAKEINKGKGYINAFQLVEKNKIKVSI